MNIIFKGLTAPRKPKKPLPILLLYSNAHTVVQSTRRTFSGAMGVNVSKKEEVQPTGALLSALGIEGNQFEDKEFEPHNDLLCYDSRAVHFDQIIRGTIFWQRPSEIYNKKLVLFNQETADSCFVVPGVVVDRAFLGALSLITFLPELRKRVFEENTGDNNRGKYVKQWPL